MAKTVIAGEQLQQLVDRLRSLFHARITRRFLTQSHKDCTGHMKMVIEKVDQSIEEYEKAVLSSIPTSNAKWLENELEKDKLFDIAALTEITARIGTEEKDDIYEEFLGLLTDLIDNIFYCQKHRKNIHFGKYKALFKLIGDELKRDTNREPSQLWYRDGQLWMRSMVPEPKTEVK